MWHAKAKEATVQNENMKQPTKQLRHVMSWKKSIQ